MPRDSQVGAPVPGLLAALVLLAAGPAAVPVTAAGTSTPTAPDAAGESATSSVDVEVEAATVAALAPLGITDTLQRIDRILESVLDLVRTINQLFGEGEGMEGEGGAGGEGGMEGG